MSRVLTILVTTLLMTGSANADNHISFEESNIWIATQLEFKQLGDDQKFAAALTNLMNSELGQKFPGTTSLNWLMVNGDNPKTHGLVNLFPSMAASSAWNSAFWTGASPEVATWLKVWSETVKSSREIAYSRVASWGSLTNPNPTSETIPFYTDNLPALVSRHEQWMQTKTARKFKGQVSIHQCAYCGDLENNALFVVSHNTSKELDEWRAIYRTSKDFASWIADANELAELANANLIYRMATFSVNSKELL